MMYISHVASPYLHEQTMHTYRDTHSHMHTLTHAHMHTWTPMQTHTHAHTHTCAHMHTQTHAENELNIFLSSLLSLTTILSLSSILSPLLLSPEHSGRSVLFQVMESSLLRDHIGSMHCTYGTRGLAPSLRCSLDRRGKPCLTLQ